MSLSTEEIQLVKQANQGLRFWVRTSEYRDNPDYTGWLDVYYEVRPKVVLESLGTTIENYPFSVANGDRIVNGLVVDSPLFAAVYIGEEDLDQDLSTPE